MSNNKSNELVALEWLLTPLNEQMDAIHATWQQSGGQVDLAQMSSSFHALANVLKVANLSVFAELAQTLKLACLNIFEGKLERAVAPKVFYASKLLQHELNRYVITGLDNTTLVALKTHYIDDLIGRTHGQSEGGSVVDDVRFSTRFAAISGELLKLSDDNYQKLLAAWRHASMQLLDVNRNDNEYLGNLKKVVQYLRQATNDHALKNLWQLTNFWLSSLMANDEPVPSNYAYLLSELDKAIILQQNFANDVDSVVWLENVLIDIYVQLGELKTATEETHELLSGLNSSLASEQTFFPHILGVLEGVLFGLARGEIFVEVLEDVKEQLAHRGWSFYESYTDQIIQDIRSSQHDPELFSQMQWQINTQLQDLYSAIQSTHEAIENKIGDSIASQPAHTDAADVDPLRRVRILVEDLKLSFSDYLHSKNVSDLADEAHFTELDQIFGDMAMYEVATMSKQLSVLFEQLKQQNPERVSWQFAHATADGLSLLELFLDGLAKQVFDNALLTRAKEQLTRASEALDIAVDESDEFSDSKSVGNEVRYDDSGEVMTQAEAPVAADVDGDIHSTEMSFDEASFDEVVLDDTVVFEDVSPAHDVSDTDMVANDMVVNDTPANDASIDALSDEPSEELSEEQSTEVLLLTDTKTNESLSTSNEWNAAHEDSTSADTAQALVVDELSENYLAAKQSLKPDEFDFDEDIREIFIEEADEVLTAMAELLPVWQYNPQNLTPLKDIRRGFHTLKGSGRMVGAFSVGEMAWSVENMLNRVLDGTVSSSNQIADFVSQTAELIPTLVTDFANKQDPSLDPAIVVLKANNILAGRAVDDGVPVSVAQSGDDLQANDKSANKDTHKDAPSTNDEWASDETVALADESDALTDLVQLDESQDVTSSDVENILGDEVDGDVSIIESPMAESSEYDDSTNNADEQPMDEQIVHDVLIDDDVILVDESHPGDELFIHNADESFIDDEQSDDVLNDDVSVEDVTGEHGDVLTADEAAAVSSNADNVPAGQMPEVLLPFLAEAQKPIESSLDEVDEDIKEIFIEEALEVLEDITPKFETWQQTQDDKALLTDIRRGFHTLKGSGRMVGATELGELAWSVENMFNRVLDGTITMNDGMCALVADILAQFADLVKIFENNGTHYPEQVVLWTACAHAYSRGHGDEFDYRQLSANTDQNSKTNQDLQQDKSLDESLAGNDTQDDTQTEDAMQMADDEAPTDALHSIKHEVKDVLSNAQIVAPLNDEERQLCDIFIEEARDLLASISQYLAEHQDSADIPVSDDIVRAFHTMRGASALAPLAAVSDVGARIEQALQVLQKNDELMTKNHLKTLAVSVSMIGKHLNSYEAHVNGKLVDTNPEQLAEEKHLIEDLLAETESKSNNGIEVSELIDGIDVLLDAELELESAMASGADNVQSYAQTMLAQIETLEERTTQLGKFQRLLTNLSHGYDVLARHPEQASDDVLLDRLLAVHSELTGLFDSLAGSMSLRLNEQALTALDAKVADIQEYYRDIDSHELIEVKADGALHDVADLQSELVEFQEVTTDDDLLEIFLEEAGELDTAIGEAFGQWRSDTSNTEALKQLQRHLHTIKGGARLAGISSIGDLTHEAETVYEQMVTGRLAPSAGWVQAMQGVQDILSLQIEEVRQNKRSFFATQAVSKLQAFLAAGEVPEGTTLSLPILTQTESTESAPVEMVPADEPKSDFEIRQQRSWQGQLPDKDILAVFLEEAEDLVETSAEDFQVFRSNTGDVATLQALQRKLHTIKGGARMVSANGVADLAHNMEMVYEDLGSRRRPATRMVTQLLLVCHDWMTQAIVLLKANLNPPRPAPLIEALENFSRRPDSLTEVPVVSLSDELDAIAAHEAFERQRRGGHDISRMPPMSGLFTQSEENTSNNEMIRISAGLMERMINLSGEAAINRARIDMSMTSLTASIEEMGSTVQRLHDQLRRMDIELEAQILAQIDDKTLIDSGEFDPLEMDQYSSLNQLSKSLSESASDLLDLKATLLEKTRDGENLLLQLSRTQTELQDGLMNSRMVPFSRLTPRLQRIVRQISAELGKNVELSVINADDEMDRTILERITSPLEHMLRNAMDHGIELPDERAAMGKSRTGHIVLEVVREGSEVLIHLTDDGAGINVDAVRKKAISQGLIDANDTTLTDLDIMQYIFNAGLSTTSVVTQISGRGVGMDVVRSEIRQLGGSVSVDSVRGQGSKFTMRVPLTVAVSDALVVRAADRHYGIPLVQIERVTQVSPKELLAYYQSNQSTFVIDNQEYRLRYLNEILSGHNFSELMNASTSLPVIIVKNQAGQNLALQVDEIIGSRIEVVVKPLGRQLSHVAGISAATIMGDGSVMLILDLMALIRNARARVAAQIEAPKENRRPVVLVVDDSVTVRKVTSRFLERQGFEAVVAKDGVDAIEILQELNPDLMLLDIEMPRMDGFEVTTQVRHNQRLKDLPIIMITSRTGEKHRERAFEIGVSDYMGKPFQENELLERITALLPNGLLVK